MSMHALQRTKGIIYDLLLAVALLCFILTAAMSATVGNTSFYSHFLNDEEVTLQLKSSLQEEILPIAEKTGIEEKAFEFAVGPSKISSVQKDIVRSAFSGTDYNYSDSANIEICYRYGIGELALGFKVFTYSAGRTKVFSHYACSLLSTGLTLVLLFSTNMLTGYSNKLYLTNNEALNYALSHGFNAYFFVEACFGIAFIIAGVSMMAYFSQYYRHKAARIKQEQEINHEIYVASAYGDVTIGDIAQGNIKDDKNKD